MAKTKFNLCQVEARVKSKVRDNMAAAALFVQGEATKLLGQKGSRDVSLDSSLSVDSQEVTATISARGEFAGTLELGTPEGRPRSFLRPAILNNKREILALLRRK